MEISLTLALPRDEMSVPVVRRLLRQAMQVLGVDPEVVADLEVALTEACTNVLDHASSGDEYEVGVGIADDRCVLEISQGQPFDGSAQGHGEALETAEDGRGLQLVRALVDKVEFRDRSATSGTVVRLEKALCWPAGSAVRRLADGQPTGAPPVA